MLQAVGIQDSYVTQIILGAVNFGCTFGGLYVMEKFGRRLPLIYGGLWQAAWLFVFAAAGEQERVMEQWNSRLEMARNADFCIGSLQVTARWSRTPGGRCHRHGQHREHHEIEPCVRATSW